MRAIPSRLLSFLGFAALLTLFSCLGTPEKNTELAFTLDTSLVGDFDSIRVTVYGAGDTTADLNQVIRLSSTQRDITVGLPGSVNGNFTVVLTGFKSGSEVYKKEFSYLAGETAPTGTPRDLLRIPPSGISIADTTIPLYDTLSPLVVWTPPNATERGYALSQRGSDTTLVSVLGNRLVARALGTADLMAVTDTLGMVDYFFVTVRPPEFTTDIKPIIQTWCGKCHHPLAPINLQDSATLVAKGPMALMRLNLPVNDPNHMPADTVNRVLPDRDFSMLIYWLQHNLKPVTGLGARDTVIALGDSIIPALTWTPADAGNRNYTMSSSNQSKVDTSGYALLANDTGFSMVTATSLDGGFTATFRVTVRLPDFETRVKPITASKCAPCHAPGQTWNFQDSGTLVEHGSEAIRRVQLPMGIAGRMPADSNLVLTSRQLRTLLGWLGAFVVPLDSIRVAPMNLRLGDTARPNVTWFPANASNKKYSLDLFSTNMTLATSTPDSQYLIGLSLGGPTTAILQPRANNSLKKQFSITVIPMPVDSIRGVDTGGSLNVNVIPRIRVSPPNATDTTWTLRTLNASMASVTPPNILVGLTLGSHAAIEVTSNSNPAIKDTFDFAVGFRVTGVRAIDTVAPIGAKFAPRVIVSPTSATDRSYSLTPLDTAVVSLYDTVSGIPRLQAKNYGGTEVVATSTDGAFTDTLHVDVVVAAPANLVYSSDPVTYTTGSPIPPNTPTVGGGVPTGYTVTPALPSGLTLNPATGVITGTPTREAVSSQYRVTAANGTGSTSMNLTITVSLAPPSNLVYSTNPASYSTNVNIPPNQPSYSGGTPSGYTVTPALPAGLTLNPTTGIITGIPTAATAPSNYTITATNVSGSTTARVNIEVVFTIVAPSNLTYGLNPALYTMGTTLAPNSPSYSGGVPTGFTVSPALPAGIALDPVTGVISGTPTAITAAANYTVTATNSAGFTTVPVNITVRVAAPANLTYSANPVTYTVGTVAALNNPSTGGGAPTGYSVTPALPAGLTLSPTTGAISGTPTTVTAAANYTVTAFNGTGSATASLNITVRVAAPASITYPTNPAVYSVGVPIVSNTPTFTGGAPTSYSVNPALPAGLTLNTVNGAITGTPTAARALAGYTVTATNGTGFTTAALTITVNNILAVSISFSPVIPTTLFVDSVYVPTVLWNPTNTTNRTFTLSTTTTGTISMPTTTTFRTIYIGTGNVTATSFDGPRTPTATFNIVRPPYSKVLPILTARCNTCHTAASGLTLLDSTRAMGMSATYPTLTLRSEIVRRIQILPANAPQHMPGDGVTILPTAEMNAMIRYFTW